MPSLVTRSRVLLASLLAALLALGCNTAPDSNVGTDTLDASDGDAPLSDTDWPNPPSECTVSLTCDLEQATAGATLPRLWVTAVADGSAFINYRLVPADTIHETTGWVPMRQNGIGHGWIDPWTAPETPGTYVLQVRAAGDLHATTGWTTCLARGELNADPPVICPMPDDPPAGFDVQTMRKIEILAP